MNNDTQSSATESRGTVPTLHADREIFNGLTEALHVGFSGKSLTLRIERRGSDFSREIDSTILNRIAELINQAKGGAS